MSVHRRLPTLRRPGRWPVTLIIVIVIAGAVLIAMAQGSLTLGPRDGSSPQSVPDDHMLPPAAVAPPASISLPDSSRVVASTKDETLQEVAVVPARVWFAPSGKAVLADAVVLVKFLRTRPSDRFGVWVLDASGAQLGVVETSFSPMAIWRSSTQELLVSEAFEGFQARLVALDLTNQLTPKWQMDMPGRIEYTIYWPGMVLSTDEKYLFYQTHRYEQSDICQHSSDGPACSLYGLGVVDLTTSPPTPTELPLPRDCGVAGLHPLGTAAVTVACTGSSRLLVVGNDHLSIADVTPLGGLPSDPRPNRPSTAVANALAGYERSDGSLGLLLSGGDFWVVNAGRVAKQVRAVPEGAHVQSVGQLDARNGVVAIPYRSGSAQTAAGVASFNLETLAVDGLAPSAQGASFVANSGPATRLLIGDLVAEQSAPGGVAGLFRGFDAQAGWAIIR